MEKKDFKNKTKKILNDKTNLLLVLILILSLIVRIYFFAQTTGQTYWWDEAEYMATAKHWAFGVPYDLNQQRPPLFQLFATAILYIGLSESTAKFLLVVIPSIILVFITYLVGKELFGDKVGLIGALGVSMMWSFLFWATRFQPDFISVSLQMLSILFFWKLFKKPNKIFAILAGLFSGLAFYFKISALLIPLAIFFFVIFKDGLGFIKNKFYWYSLLSFVISLIPFMLWQYSTFGNPLAFAPSYIGGTGIGQGWSFGWMTLDYYYLFAKLPFFVLFISGIIISLGSLALRYDGLLKEKASRLDGRIFSIILLGVVTLFYIFYIRGTIEDRWVFIIAPFIFYFSGYGLVNLANYLKKYYKHAGTILLIIFLSVFIYYQIQHASQLTELKKESYSQIKKASLYLKENMALEESALSVSYTQSTTYSERKIYTYADMSKENFTKLLNEEKPSYLLASILEPHHPQWLISRFEVQGFWGIRMDYFNSTILVSPQGQIVQTDIKPTIIQDNIRFDFVYPREEINGVFVYKITYL